MKEQRMTKPAVIEKIKKGSKWIAVICILAAFVNLGVAALRLPTLTHAEVFAIQSHGLYPYLRQNISLIRNTVIMVLAAVMFFRIAKDGIPFTAKNVRTVRIIGILFLADALIPTAGTSGDLRSLLSNPSALIEGLLFLFIAHIIRYGAMLQQESDETL